MKGVEGDTLIFDGWHCAIEWKLQDLWVGVYWKRIGNAWDIWVCLLPCLPLHVSWWFRDPAQ